MARNILDLTRKLSISTGPNHANVYAVVVVPACSLRYLIAMADPVSVNPVPVVDSGAVPTPAADEQPGHKVGRYSSRTRNLQCCLISFGFLPRFLPAIWPTLPLTKASKPSSPPLQRTCTLPSTLGFSCSSPCSLSAQVIFRGTRSAGYGFVAFNTAEAAQKAVELLNKKELDGRTLIVEVAKPTEEKQKEKKEKRAPKKRSSKKSKGEQTDGAAVNGTTDAAETKDTAEKSEAAGDAKPKKKRNTVRLAYSRPKHLILTVSNPAQDQKGQS